MREQLERLGSRLLDRLVPALEASAASNECKTCIRCVKGTSGCGSTDHRWWQQRLECSDGTTPWRFGRCGYCTPGYYRWF
ncbi:hypothetical protein RB200_34955 [Streptomyces sp. PmtG]